MSYRFQKNHCLSPLLVLEQLCRRTGAWCSALRRVSRFTGVSLTGVTGSETTLPGSLAGSGGDSMLCFRLELLLLVYHDAPRCDSELRGLLQLCIFLAEVRNVEQASVDRGGCVGLIVHWQRQREAPVQPLNRDTLSIADEWMCVRPINTGTFMPLPVF